MSIATKLGWAAAIGAGVIIHDQVVKRIIRNEQQKALEPAPQLPTVAQLRAELARRFGR